MKQEIKKDAGTIAANLAMFLHERTGSIYTSWRGTMSAKLQRKLFGEYRFGKREIRLNGVTEQLHAVRTLCFGNDFECETFDWREL